MPKMLLNIIKTKLSILTIICVINGCTNLNIFNKKKIAIVISSKNPNTTVSIFKNDKRNDVGKTPITLTLEHDTKEPVRLLFSKHGYISKEVILDISTSSNISIDIELVRFIDELQLNDDAYTQFFNNVATKIHQANSYIQTKDYKQALSILRSLEEQFPSSYIINDMLGSVHYLSNKPKEALNYYKRSLLLNPTNAPTKTIIEKIQVSR